jgi:hypothetical protein
MEGPAENMSEEECLEAIRFEWTSDRNVRLKIGDTTLAFSTG